MPAALQAALDGVLAPWKPSVLATAMAALSDHYARARPSAVDDAIAHAAYLGARLPATYGAVAATLDMVPPVRLDDVRSVIDLGAGPGTASLAAASRCRHLERVLQIDRSPALLALGRQLATASAVTSPIIITQAVDDVSHGGGGAWPSADLVIASYVLAELSPLQQATVLDAALRVTSQLLVIVEPGTPAGFARVHAARGRCLAAGCTVLAPCSHAGVCPMQATGDWCHFAVRVPRSRLHRQVKGGTLGYEDEKFACLVVDVRGGAMASGTRVLRHPRIEKGQVGLEVCTPDRPTRVVVTRRQPGYRAARKVDWGGTWPPAPIDED